MAEQQRSTCSGSDSTDDCDMRSVYWVARGVPVEVDGMMVRRYPLDRRSWYDAAPAIALRDELRKTYPDAVVVEERPI